jgi:glycogen operon protein
VFSLVGGGVGEGEPVVRGDEVDRGERAARRRTIRNLLATLLLGTGVPMLVAGDEFGRTQHGNNNPYCLDDETSWVDWDLAPWQQQLLTTAQYLMRVRREHPVLRQSRFFAGRPVHRDGTKDLAWFGPDGEEMEHTRWHDPGQRVLQMYLHAVVRGRGGHHVDPSLLVILQGEPHPVQVRLPERRWAGSFDLLWDSAFEEPPGHPHGPRAVSVTPHTVLAVAASSVQVYRVPARIGQ